MENNPFKCPYNLLSPEEKSLINVAHEVLHMGHRLYGLGEDDHSHIEYALGIVLTELKEVKEEDAVATLIEVGVDDNGYFVRFALNGVEQDSA